MKKIKFILPVLSLALFITTTEKKVFAISEKAVESQKEQPINGTITDGINNGVIKDTYIKQIGTLNTVLSDKNGNFRINLENSGENKLLIIKENYEPVQISVNNGQEIKVKLYPVRAKKDEMPEAHTAQDDIFNYVAKPLGSNFSAMYQLRYQAQRVPGLDGNSASVIQGWAVNETALNGQLRMDNWLGSFKIFRARYPVDIKNFPYNPAYNLNITQFQLTGSKVFSESENMELAAGISYLLHSQDPDNRASGDNKPIPYTNSFSDFPQTRQGPGMTGMFGYFLNEFVTINGNATLYPFLFTAFRDLAGRGPSYQGMLEIGANIKVKTLPGIYLAGSYTNQFLFGFPGIIDDANLFSLGVSLDPFEMANLSATSSEKVRK